MTAPDDTTGGGLLEGCRVLFAGESWMTQQLHAKGVVSYTTAAYEEGGAPLIGALERAGAHVDYLPNHLAGESFPRDPGELSRYGAVVLSDLASDTLLLDRACAVEGRRSVNRIRLLQAYAEAGGGLLMVGGYMSFAGWEAKAHWAVTPLASVLPVVISEADDRVEAPEGPTPTVLDAEHPVLDGVTGEWPYFLGYNRIAPKPDARVVLGFEGGDPLLVLGRCGSGRSAAFASDCSPHWGSPAFLAWPHYDRFWCQLVAWLARADDD